MNLYKDINQNSNHVGDMMNGLLVTNNTEYNYDNTLNDNLYNNNISKNINTHVKTLDNCVYDELLKKVMVNTVSFEPKLTTKKHTNKKHKKSNIQSSERKKKRKSKKKHKK